MLESPRTIAIPTCDRTMSLRRCIEAAINKATQTGEGLRIIVSDDSRNPQEALAPIFGKFRHPNCQIVYASRFVRQQLISDIGRIAGVDDAILRFGLVGNPDRAPTFGANQNVIQLLTKGCRVTIMDDDIRFEPRARRCPALAASARGGSYEAARHGNDSFYRSSRDLLRATHQRAEVGLGTLEDSLDGAKPGETIALSCSGIYGSPPFSSRRHILFPASDLGSPSSSWTEREYRTVARTDNILHQVDRSAYERPRAFYSAFYALDNRLPLLPFFPDWRGSDALFGEALGIAYPHYRMRTLAWAVLHRRPGYRATPASTRLTFSDLMRLILAGMADEHEPPSPTQGSSAIGRLFFSMASLNDSSLRDFILDRWAAERDEVAGRLSNRLAAGEALPPTLKREIREELRSMEREMLQLPILPHEIVAAHPTAPQSLDLFRKILFQWAELCQAWPAIERAALSASPQHLE